MKRLAIALTLVAVSAGCAGSGGSTATRAPVSRKVMDVIALRAQVRAVDAAQRRVTIVDAAGDEAVLYADEAVANFDRIEVGDEVVGELIGALAIEVRPPSAQEAAGGIAITETAARAEPGQRPAGLFVRRITGVFTVAALDREAATVTLRGPSGASHLVPVRDPASLAPVKVGDTVVATYTESVRLAVLEPRPARSPEPP